MNQPWLTKWGHGELLGGGGQGDTYIVPSNDQPLGVLKVLRGSGKDNVKARARMFQEVANLRLMGSLGGNVPAVLDSNVDNIDELDKELYFVMEYISGQTLKSLVDSSCGIDLEPSVNISLAIIKTLRVAQQAQIVHRDLKPENIIVRNLDLSDIVILDFGISFHHQNAPELTEIGETFQNSLIRLPERTGIGEDKRDFRSDLTDTVAIFYYCLSGRPPRNLKESNGKSPHRNNQDLLRIRCQNETQLRRLNSFFDKGLNHEINDRFQTLDDLEARLREVLQSGVFEHNEDLSTVLNRSVGLLRNTDIKTRGQEFRKGISQHLGDFQRAIYSIGKKVDATELFRCRGMDLTRLNLPGPVDGGAKGLVYHYKIDVENRAHKITFCVDYIFEMDGNQCVVYRKIREQRQLAHQPLVWIDSYTKLLERYADFCDLDLSPLLKDAEAAIAICIEELSKKCE